MSLIWPVLALATSQPSPQAPPPLPTDGQTVACTGTVVSIQGGAGLPHTAVVFLDGSQQCNVGGGPKGLPSGYLVSDPKTGKLWPVGWDVAKIAYVYKGTVTVEYVWTAGMTSDSRPYVTSINAPCMAVGTRCIGTNIRTPGQ